MLTPPPGQATGRTGARPGRTKCIWSDFDSSRRAGGRHPPTSTPSHGGGGVVPPARLSAPGDGGTGAPRLDALGLVAGDAASAAGLRACSGHVGCAGGAR
jgi:hypothetical protein